MKKTAQQLTEWSDIMHALEFTHHTSIRNICQDLKASRSWVTNSFVTQEFCNYCDAIVLNGGNGTTAKKDWCQVAEFVLREKTNNANLVIRDKIWFDTAKYKKWLSEHVSYSRQTISIPVSFLMDRTRDAEFCKARNECYDELSMEKSRRDVDGILSCTQKLRTLYTEFLSPTGKDIFEKGFCSTLTRTEAPVVDIEAPWSSLEGIDVAKCWHAPHDMVEYGDTDTRLYREIFAKGMIKIQLYNGNGNPVKKVFYIDDPTPIAVPNDAIIAQRIPIKYQFWIELVKTGKLPAQLQEAINPDNI